MQSLILVLTLIFGTVLGSALAWLFLRDRIQFIRDQIRAETGAERVGLVERLQSREQQILNLSALLEQAHLESNKLREQIQSEAERRSASEEKNSRIPVLEDSLQSKRSEIARLREENVDLKTRQSELETKITEGKKSLQEKVAILNDSQVKLSDAFRALSSEALRNNNQSFLQLAKSSLEKFQAQAKEDLVQRHQAIEHLVLPIKESLSRFDSQVSEIEKARQQAYGAITEQVKSLVHTQEKLQSETQNLVKALRTPNVRGRWGEIQLRRVVEIAGMLPYCDFLEQVSVRTDSAVLRPDLIVKLPGKKNVVVDSKAPLQAYLGALEAQDERERRTYLKKHARQIHDHITQLSSKAYWDQFEATPEFVVLFLPGESFFSAALEQDPSLIEEGVNQRVILATPTTLIALLRAVSYGWRQERITDNAQTISQLGRELYERLGVVVEHVIGLGRGLDRAVDFYNRVVGSLESRVLVSARKFNDLGVPAKQDISVVRPIEKAPRSLQEEAYEKPPVTRQARLS